MYFMVVGKVRIKIALFAAFVSFGIMMYLAAVAIVNNNFCCSITIADSFSFSYPYAFHIDRMYSRSNKVGIIKTSSPVVVPVVNDLSDLKESVRVSNSSTRPHSSWMNRTFPGAKYCTTLISGFQGRRAGFCAGMAAFRSGRGIP